MLAPTWSPAMKSGMAIGSGWALPWVTSTCSAAIAGEANSAPKAIRESRNLFIEILIGPFILLAHHFPGIEPKRVDLLPVTITRCRQFIGRALIDCPVCRLGRGAGVRI